MRADSETMGGRSVAELELVATMLVERIAQRGARTILEIADALLLTVVVTRLPDPAGVIAVRSRAAADPGPAFVIFGTRPARATILPFLQSAAQLWLGIDVDAAAARYVGARAMALIDAKHDLRVRAPREAKRWADLRSDAVRSERRARARPRRGPTGPVRRLAPPEAA